MVSGSGVTTQISANFAAAEIPVMEGYGLTETSRDIR
jgi:long-subunit acyl-CoA synthetase (AMP-forming)